MNINTNNIPAYRNNVTFSANQEKRASSDTLVEKIVDKTYLSANYAGSGLAGAVTGFGAYVTGGAPETFRTTANAVKNIVKTEKYGPVLKAVAATGALAGGAVVGTLAAPVSLIWGAIEGVGPVDNSVPRQFTIGQGASEAYRDVKSGFNRYGAGIREDMEELGNYKLKPGERPIEIPLVRAGRTVIMGAVGAVVGGAVGLMTAAASAVTETAKGIGAALTDDRLNIAEKGFSAVTSVIGGAVHGVSYGVRSGLATFGKTVEAAWEKESVVSAGRAMVGEASTSLSASVAPRATLLEERPAEPQA
jgi:hypothetical protein